MGGVQAEVFDGDVGDGPELPKGDDGAYAAMPSGIQEADVKREVNANVRIIGAEHIKGMPEIKDFFVAVPAPVCIRIGEMAFTGTMAGTVFPASADLMAIRGCMGMDT